jgi:hypothetical protein
MVDSEVWERELHCENCNFFDDDPVPGECRKGHGKVAYLHPICENFQIRNEVKEVVSLRKED